MAADLRFRPGLGLFDATMVVIGGIIGSGIFINPYIVAQRLDSSMLVLGVWVVGGLVALAGAYAYAELGAIFPKAGGQYVYLRDAWHPIVGFLYGWALLLLIESGALAAVAIAFATHALRLVERPDASPVPLAIGAIVLLSMINFFGVKPGSRLLNVLVVLKVGALAILILAGTAAPASPGWLTTVRVPAVPHSTLVAFGFALVPVLFAYGGWQNANYVAEEIENPGRNLPLSLLAGAVAVVIIYLSVNVIYLRALGLEGLAATKTPASQTASFIFGAMGDRFVTGAITISAFGFLDLGILAPTRVYYAMAADRVFLPALARLHPRYQTPWVAILIQSTWCCALALTGRYDQLLNYVVFADWIFFGSTVAAVLVFRRTYPLSQRPPGTFTAPGYPFVQLAFVAIAAAVVASVVRDDPMSAFRGALLLSAGIPVYYWFTYVQRQG
jgi:basic amino acid/polyamine antiporter, APA family